MQGGGCIHLSIPPLGRQSQGGSLTLRSAWSIYRARSRIARIKQPVCVGVGGSGGDDMVLLFIWSCLFVTGSHSIALTCLKLRDLSTSASPVLGLKNARCSINLVWLRLTLTWL